MKTKVCLLLLTFVVCPLLAQAGSVGQLDVYQVTVSASGSMEDMGTLQKQSVASSGLINLARGRNPNDSAPAGEVLALTIDCASGGPTSLIVFSPATSNVLATIGNVVVGQSVESGTKGSAFAIIVVDSVGSSTFALDGGALALSAKITLDLGGCVTKLSAALSGYLDVVFTDLGTTTNSIVITKGKLTLGSKVGVLTP